MSCRHCNGTILNHRCINCGLREEQRIHFPEVGIITAFSYDEARRQFQERMRQNADAWQKQHRPDIAA